ncbi:MAG TPA: sulfatase-like hydrolase/transferase [Chitinophagaceae bacterium]|nr:sulfatase-like hydrolase/transferase [Chitinophagaceae bacterium]
MKLIKKVGQSNWHFVWLVLFFVFHGYSGYIGLVSFTDLLVLLFTYLFLSVVVFLLCRWLIGNRQKAAIYTSLFMLIFLFFEDIRVFVGSWRWIASLSALKIYFPISILVLTMSLIFFKKTKLQFNRLTIFLNLILIIYIIIDAGVIMTRLIGNVNNRGITKKAQTGICDTCIKPSVYFVLMDEYWGTKALKNYFNYDNSRFEAQLRQKGFNIIDNSYSNYGLTVFSMASILNMDYLKNIGEQSVFNQYGYYNALLGIKANRVCKNFEQHGYQIINYSDFDIDNHPAGISYNLLPSKGSLISNRTMYYQLKKHIPSIFARYIKFQAFVISLGERKLTLIEQRLSKTIDDASRYKQKASFTYLHLNMPHNPFAYDSTGINVLNKWYDSPSLTQKDSMYLQYLVYTNKRVFSFIDTLQKVTQNKSVIILMSDHGYRRVASAKDTTLDYQNFFAIYAPLTLNSFHRDSISGVNVFRLLFNDLFHQNYPLLKDSLVTK